MIQLLEGSLRLLQGEEAAKALALDLRLYNDKLDEEEGSRGLDPVTISAIAASINATVSLASLFTQADRPDPPPPEVQDELTVLLRNNSGLTLVPVRHETDRGSLSVAMPGRALSVGESGQMMARTTGLAGSNLLLTLLVDDTQQRSVIDLTLDKVPGKDDERGWHFSAAETADTGKLALPALGNRELVAVIFEAGPGELQYALYLRGCQTPSGTVSIALYDRTERESDDVDTAFDAFGAETSQIVRIVAEKPDKNGKKRYLTDRGEEKTKAIVKTGRSSGDRQSWRLLLKSNGSIAFQNVATKRYLTRERSGALRLRGSKLTGRWWRLQTDDSASEPFKLRAENARHYLRVDDGTDKIASLAIPVSATRWVLETVSQSAEPQRFQIRSRVKTQDGKTLAMQQVDEEPVVRGRVEDSEEERQQWTVTFQENGYVQLKNVATKNYLANFANRKLIAIEDDSTSASLWRVRTNGGMEFALQNVNIGNINLVDIRPGDPSGKRDRVNVAPPTRTDRQQWRFYSL